MSFSTWIAAKRCLRKRDRFAERLLHRPLFIRQHYPHLFQRQPIQRAGFPQALGRLVPLQTRACAFVEFSCFLTRVKCAVLENLLRLLDLILVGPEGGLPRLPGFNYRVGIGGHGRTVRILSGDGRRKHEEQR